MRVSLKAKRHKTKKKHKAKIYNFATLANNVYSVVCRYHRDIEFREKFYKIGIKCLTLYILFNIIKNPH